MKKCISKIIDFRLFKSTLSLVLCVQIGFGTVALQQANAQVAPKFTIDVDLNGVISKLPPSAQEDLKSYVTAIEKIATGQLPIEAIQLKNTGRVANQFVEIVGNGNYSLNELQINPPAIAVTTVKVKYDRKNRTLVFEGVRGENSKGQFGEVVARHYIPDIDAVSIVQDKEMVAFVSSKGELNVMAMDQVIPNIFKAPLVVAERVWEPLETLEPTQNYKVKFVNSGTDPSIIQNAPQGAVLPMRDDNQVDAYSGDIMVTRVNSAGQEELVGLFNRVKAYDHILTCLKYLMAMTMQIFPDRIKPELARAMLSDMDMADAKVNFETATSQLPEVFRRAFLNIDPQKLLAASKFNQGRRDVTRHSLHLPKWFLEFEAIRKQAEREVVVLSEALRVSGGHNNPENLEAEEKLANIQSMLASGDFSSAHRELLVASSLTPNPRNRVKQETVIQAKLGWLKDISFKYVAPVLATGALLGYPFVYESSETLQQIKALGFLYEHYSPVLKDIEYRNVLVPSILSLLSLWILKVAASWSLGKSFALIGKVLHNSRSRFAGIIRDFSDKWANLSVWQRSGTFGLRALGTFNYPPVRATLAHVLRQPNLITAWNSGLKPFTVVKKDSQLGLEVGLEKNVLAGWVNPFTIGEKRKRAMDRSNRILGLMAEKQKRVDAIAWKLAVLMVSQTEGLDPASIEMVANGSVDTKNLEAAFRDASKQKEWQLLHNENLQLLKGLADGLFKEDYSTPSSVTMQELVDKARDIAKKVKSEGKNEKYLRFLAIQSKKMMKVPYDFFINFGVEDSAFMRKIFMDKTNADQTERAFIPDYFIAVGYMGVWGGRADLSKPHNLSADADGIWWTSGPHWSDIGMQFLIHILIASSRRALVYQKVKPHEEESYDPIEKDWVGLVDKRDSLSATFRNWTEVFDPRKSDIGEIAWNSIRKRVTTVLPGLYLSMGLRMFFNDDTFINSFWGYAIFFNLSFLMFAWPWLFIETGAYLLEEHTKGAKAEFAEVQRLLNLSLQETNENRAQQYRQEGFAKMAELLEKYNPKFAKVMDQLSKSGRYEQMGKELISLNETVKATNVLPAMKLMSALKLKTTQNPSRVNRAKGVVLVGERDELVKKFTDELREAIKTGQDDSNQLANIDRLSAEDLITIGLEELPIATRAHPLVNWINTVLFGAIGTTVMSVPLSILSFNQNFYGPGWFAAFTAINAGTYLLTRKALSRNGWVAQRLNNRDQRKSEAKLLQRQERAKQLAAESSAKNCTDDLGQTPSKNASGE